MEIDKLLKTKVSSQSEIIKIFSNEYKNNECDSKEDYESDDYEFEEYNESECEKSEMETEKVNMKQCSKCKRTKTLNKFGTRGNQCRDCINEMKRANRANKNKRDILQENKKDDAETEIKISDRKECSNCNTMKPLSDFAKRRNQCRVCFNKLKKDNKNKRDILQEIKRNELGTEFKAPDVKTCSRCMIEKKIIEFGKDGESSDGMKRRCKVCVNQYVKFSRDKRKDRYAENEKPETKEPETKECQKCHETKSYKDFPNRSENASGLAARCLKCTAEMKKIYGQTMKERKFKEPIPESKKCSTCQIDKAIEEYTQFIDGQCRSCRIMVQNERKRKLRERDDDEIKIPEKKICRNCKLEKNIEFFNKERTNLDGMSQLCRECAAIEVQKATEKNLNRNLDEIEIPLEKICAKCNQVKPKNCFNLHLRYANVLSSYCRLCCSIGRVEITNYKDEIKKAYMCAICGEKDIYYLTFDHLDQKNKLLNLADAWSKEQIDIEFKKCRILCSCCHRLWSKEQRRRFKDKKIKIPKTSKSYKLKKEFNLKKKLEVGGCGFCSKIVNEENSCAFDCNFEIKF